MVKSMRQSLIQDKQLDKISKLLVKDQIIQFREIEKQIKSKREIVQFAQKNWIQIFGIFHITEYIYVYLQEQRRKQKVVAKGKLLVWALKTKALIDVKEFGDDSKERTIFKCRCVLNNFATIIRSKTNNKQNLFSLNLWIKPYYLQQSLTNTKVHLIKVTINDILMQLKTKKRLFRDKFWKLIKENIADILYDLRRQKENSFFFEKQQVVIDVSVMNQVIDEYNKKQRVLWIEYIQHTYLQKDQKKKIDETALNLKEPKIYDLPNRNELSLLIEQYAKQKKLL